MRIQLLACVALIVLTGVTLTTHSQNKSSTLSDIEDNLVRSVEREMAEWKHKPIEPIEGSRDVAINQWSLDNKVVSVTIIRHSSMEDAKTSIRQFANDMKAAATSADSGDEQYSLPRRGSIVYRKDRFTVNLFVKSSDPEEEKKMIKEWAHLISRAIKDN